MSKTVALSITIALNVIACAHGLDATLSGDEATTQPDCAPPVVQPVAVMDGGELDSRSQVGAYAMVASQQGIALVEVESLHVVATANTRFKVSDIAFDHWRDRWIVAEYNDTSANQVSVWRVTMASAQEPTLSLESSLSTEGYCRLAAAQEGFVVFEDNGLRQRWLLSSPDLAAIRLTTPAWFPSDAVTSELQFTTRVYGLLSRKTSASVSVAVHEIGPLGVQLVSQSDLPEWYQSSSPARIAQWASSSFVVAQSRDSIMRVALINGDGRSSGQPIDLTEASSPVVEDIASDPPNNLVFVLLSGANRLVVVHFQPPERIELYPLPEGVAPGVPAAFSRMLAFDDVTGLLLVGTAAGVVAFRRSDTQTLQRIPAAQLQSLRWPVEMGLRNR